MAINADVDMMTQGRAMAASWLQRRRDEADKAVIRAFRTMDYPVPEVPSSWHHSYDLKALSGLRWKRFWFALRRLQESGVVEDRWEDTDPKHPRRMYRLAVSQAHNPASGNDQTTAG